MSDGRHGNVNGTVTSWIGGMSITQDGNLIAPDKIMSHVHRYLSPHYNPHGHHYHRWSHEPGGSDDPLYATKTVYGAGYKEENRTYLNIATKKTVTILYEIFSFRKKRCEGKCFTLPTLFIIYRFSICTVRIVTVLES